jgi:hypothetical protein
MLMTVCTESMAPLMTIGNTMSERWSGTEMPIVRALPCSSRARNSSSQ